jgi:hypothetical protein
MQKGELAMKMKFLSAVAGLAALCVAPAADAQVLLKGYYNFTGTITAEAGAGCAAPVGTYVTENINWPGYGKTGFAIANGGYFAGAAGGVAFVENGFPKTAANPAALAGGWVGAATYTIYAYLAPNFLIIAPTPTPAAFTIALASPVNGIAFGTITFNIPALGCVQTWSGTMIESSS